MFTIYYKIYYSIAVGGRWIVGGIWPVAKDSPGPIACSTALPFDPKALEPIKSKLEIHWTNVRTSQPVDEFWRHVWVKHGSCAAQLEPLDTELKYFSKGK